MAVVPHGLDVTTTIIKNLTSPSVSSSLPYNPTGRILNGNHDVSINKIDGYDPNNVQTLTDHERQEEAPDRQEPTRVTHVVEGHRRLHEPLAPPYRGPELVAHGQDRQALAR